MTKTYTVTELFYAPQGEGVRAGSMNVFVRFAGCNLTCQRDSHGFDCDTEFSSGRKMTAEQIVAAALAVGRGCRWMILTGGEPALQADLALIKAVKDAGYQVAIETNGSVELYNSFPEREAPSRGDYLLWDWITVSPKVAEHAIRQRVADEVKYVRYAGQAIPKTVVQAEHYLLSPAWETDGLSQENLRWVMELCRDHPTWRISIQLHKLWRSR